MSNITSMKDYQEGQLRFYGSTDRVKKLNAQQREAKPAVSLDRARAYTQVYQQFNAMPPITRRAMATSKALQTITLHIEEGQLIIGSDSGKFKARELNPELDTAWILMEGGIGTLPKRTVGRFEVSPEDQEEFTKKMAPYWADKTIIAKLLNLTDGTITNMYITKDLLSTYEGRMAISNLVQSYFDEGGAHIQFSCTDKETLKDAQLHPDRYPNLLVRVAGYSAYFVDLTKEVQDSIISRTVFQAV